MTKTKSNYLNFNKIGKMTVYDVLVKEQFPVIFVCKDIFNSKYLFYETYYDEIHTEWITTKITSKQYLELKTNIKTLQQVFKESYSKQWFKIIENGIDDFTNTQELNHFPSDIFKIDIPVFVGRTDIPDDELKLMEQAIALDNSFVDIRLTSDPSEFGIKNASIKPSVIEKLSSVFRLYFKGYNISDSSQRLQLLEGSTIVRFYFEDYNLLTPQDSTRALEDFHDAIVSNNSSQLYHAFKGDISKIKKYQTIIKTLHTLDGEIDMKSATPNKTIMKSHKLSDKVLKKQLEVINNIYTEQIIHREVEAQLFSINVRTKKVEFYDEKNEILKGELLSQVDEGVYRVPNKYKFTLRVENMIDLDGNIKSSKILVENLSNIEEI